MPLPDWARAHGAALFSGVIRSRADDFDVTEELGFDFSGDGEHDYLFIEKRGANTEWLSRQLAGHAGVPARDVGYAGLKDRHAVTRQWFSVPRWNLPDWNQLAVDGARLLEQRRHHRKLRRGAHQGNRFRIVVRGALPHADDLDQRLTQIAALGVPNYFGEQRFGRGASNLALADDWSRGKRLPRHRRSIAISTIRSFLFNEFLDARVRADSWNRLVDGDVANLDGSGSIFVVTALDEELRRRCGLMDLHPAGPLYGDVRPSCPVAAAHEEWLTALKDARVKPANRSLRLRVRKLEWTARCDALDLTFALGRGAYATAVLRELAHYSSPPPAGNQGRRIG